MAKRENMVKEDVSINFRLPEELKKEIIIRAKLENKTVSKYLNDHLKELVSGSLYENELADYYKRKFINSTEFIQLLVWMYRKQSDKTCTSDDEQFDRYINTLKKVGNELPKVLAVEFDKVLYDVLRVKKEESEYDRKFNFSKNKSNENVRFNY
jgi:hypothetical protein